jgi:foldase protein PrsA
MDRKLKGITLILLIILLSLSCAYSAPKPSTRKTRPAAKTSAAVAPAPKEVEWAAKVNDDIISMDWYNRIYEASIKQITKETSIEAAEEKGIIRETKRSILEQMIEAVILLQWADREGIDISEKSIKYRIQQLKKTFPSSKEFHKSLAEQGMSLEDLERDIKKQIIIDKLITIRSKSMAVSDEEMKAFYDKNSDLYLQKEKLHLKQLFFKDNKDAQAALAELGPKSKFGGEDIGLVEQGQLPLYDDSSLFQMDAGQVSGVISGEAGYYIFRIEEKLPQRETKFEDAKNAIRKFLLGEKARLQYLKDLQEEKTNAKIILNDKLGKLF